MNSFGKFYGVGVGPGDPQLLTLRAVQVLQSVPVIAIPKSRLDRESVAWEIARPHCNAGAFLLELELPMTSDQIVLAAAWREAAAAVLAKLQAGLSVAFITLGDPSLYSTYCYLVQELNPQVPAGIIETIPGISALSLAAARLNMPLATGDEPLLILPSADEIDEHLGFANLVLMKVSRRLPQLLSKLTEAGKQYVLATRLGQTGEQIRRQPELTEIGSEKIDYLSLLLVKNGEGK